MSTEFQTVFKALGVLYSPAASTNPQLHREADKFLTEYRASSGAWKVAVECLQTANNVSVQFYGAVIFRDKMQYYFSQLPISEHAKIRSTLVGLLLKQQPAYPPQVTGALASALALMGAKTADRGFSTLIAELLKLAPSAPAVVLHVLTLIPEQLTRAALSIDRAKAAKAELKSALEPVLGLIRVCLTPPNAAGDTKSPQKNASAAAPASPAPNGTTATTAASPAQLIQQTIAALASPPPSTAASASSSPAAAAGASGQNRLFEFYDTALSCLLSWATAISISIGDLSRLQLIAPLMQMFASLHPKCTARAGEVLEAALEVAEESPQLHNAGLSVVVTAFLATAKRLTDKSPASLWRAVANVNNRLCEFEIEWFCRGSAEALTLVELQFRCTNHASRSVAVASLDFWSIIQEVPSSQRPPALREVMFRKLLEPLLRHCSYPADMNSFDSDEFDRVRSLYKEILIPTYHQLQASFIASVCQLLNPKLGWSACESMLWALSIIAQEMISIQPQNFAALDEQLTLFFRDKLKTLPASPQLTNTVCRLMNAYAFWLRRQPPLVSTAIQYLVGAAHALSQKDGGAGSVGSYAAGEAFKRVCTECAPVVAASPKSFEPVIAYVLGASNATATGDCKLKSLATETGTCFVDGLVILARALPLSAATDDRTAALQHIANGLFASVKAYVAAYSKAATPPTAAAATATATAPASTAAAGSSTTASSTAASETAKAAHSALIRHIWLLNSLLIGLDMPVSAGATAHPANGIVSTCFELLPAVLQMFARDVSVCDAVLTCIESVVSSVRALGITRFVSLILKACTVMYERFHSPKPLHVLKAFVAAFAPPASATPTSAAAPAPAAASTPAPAPSQWTEMLGFVFAHTSALARGDVKSHADVFVAVFELCDAVLSYQPAAMLHKDTFGLSLDLVAVVLSAIQDRACVLSALEYLMTVLNAGLPLPTSLASTAAGTPVPAPQPIDAASLSVLNQHLTRMAEPIITRVLYGVCGQMPESVTPKMTRVLFAFITRAPDLSRKSLGAALAAAQFPGTHLTPDNRRLILDVIWAKRTSGDAVFLSVMKDISSIARGLNTTDSLLPYLLKPTRAELADQKRPRKLKSAKNPNTQIIQIL